MTLYTLKRRLSRSLRFQNRSNDKIVCITDGDNNIIDEIVALKLVSILSHASGGNYFASIIYI